MRKRYDLSVKIGEYDDKASNTKKPRWKNIGSLMIDEDGSKFVLLDKFINYDMLCKLDKERDNIFINVFECKDRENRSSSFRFDDD